MFKKCLVAAVFVMASVPALVSADDIFFSFDENARVPAATLDASVTNTGSIYIFSDINFDFNQLDIDFTNSDPSVVAFSDAVVFNSGSLDSGTERVAEGGKFTSLQALNPDPPLFDVNGNPVFVDANGNTFDVNGNPLVDANGNPIQTSPNFVDLDGNPDPNGFVEGITATDGRLFAASFQTNGIIAGNTADPDFRAGANGFLLARVDFDITGLGDVNFDFILGELGVVNEGVGPLDPTFASGTLSVIPEPSSAIVLILSTVGLATRRRRS